MFEVDRHLAIVAGQHGRMNFDRHPDDLYETPAEAVQMLLHHAPILGPILEPSAGRGAIVRVLTEHGFSVLASDLHDHNADPVHNIETGVDFLRTDTLRGCRSIVMNPPFGPSDQHVRHALSLLGNDGVAAVLLRWNWIAAKKRADLLTHLHMKIIAGRLKMLPPGAEDRGHSGTTDFGWFIFRTQPVQATRIVAAHRSLPRTPSAGL